MSDANSVSNRSTLAHTTTSAHRDPRGSVGRDCKIWSLKGRRVKRQQLSQPASRLVVLHEISFSFQCFFGHALALVYGPGCLFKDFARDDGAVFGESDRQGSREPTFHQADAADGAFIAIVEVLQKIRFPWQWQVPSEGEQDALEGTVILAPIRLIAREMNVNAAPAQLPAQVAERKNLISSDQYVNCVGQAGEGLDGIKLVLELATTSHLGEMLCLVNKECSRATMYECIFESVTHFQAWSPRIQGESASAISEDAANAVADLAIDQRFLQRNESASIVILPTELGGIGGGLDTDDGNASGIIFQSCEQGLLEMLFNTETQGCLPDTSGPVDKDQRPASRVLDGLLKRRVGFFQPGMGHRERAKVGESRLGRLLQQGPGEAFFRHVLILLENLGLKQHGRLSRHRLPKFSSDWTDTTLRFDSTPIDEVVHLLSLSIPEALQKQRFFRLDGSHEVSQFPGRQLGVAGMISKMPAKLCCGQHHFSFRATAKDRVVLGAAADPVVSNIGIRDSNVVGVVADRNESLLNSRVAESIRPVVEGIDLDALAGRDQGCPLLRRWQCHQAELVVIRNRSMGTKPAPGHAVGKTIAGRLAECGMHGRVIQLVGPLAKAFIESAKRPHSMVLGIHRGGDGADFFGDLGVARQVVDQLRVGSAKDALTDRAEASLGGRPGLFGAFIAREQCFEVHALEFLAAIHYENLWKTTVAVHTFSENHHARAVARRIEGQHDCEQAARKGVGQEREPGATEVTCCARTPQFNVEFGVIDVANVKGTIAVPGRSEFEFPVRRLEFVSGPASLSLEYLFTRRPPIHFLAEGFVTGRWRAVRLAGPHQRPIHMQSSLLLERFVIILDELRHECLGLVGEPRSAVAALAVPWQQAEITAPISRFSLAILLHPIPDGSRGNIAQQWFVRLIRTDDLEPAVGLRHLIRSHPDPLPLWFGGHHPSICHVEGATQDLLTRLRFVVARGKADALWMNQRCRSEVGLNDSRRNEHVDVIPRRQSIGASEKVAQRDSWSGRDEGEHGFSSLLVDRRRLCPKVVFQELDVPLVGPVNLARRPKTIIEAQRAGFGFARRATPCTLTIGAIAIRVVLGQLDQIFFGLPFFPTSLGRTNDKEVRCVDDSQALSVCALVAELQWWRLVVVLQNVRVVLHLANGGQFHSVALELDGYPHLAAGISAAYVRSASMDSTCRLGRPNAVDQASGSGGHAAPFIARFQFLSAEHGRSTSSSGCAVALRRRTLLKRAHVTHTGIVDQRLQQAPVPESGTNFRHQSLWDVDRKSAATMAAIEHITAVALSGLAGLAVLPDARALPQGEGSRCYRPELLDGFQEPTPEISALITVHVCAYQATHTHHSASIILLGGLKEVIHPLTPHSWQNYVSVLHFRQRYASDSNERGDVRIADEGGCGWPDGKPMFPKRQIYG